MEGKKKRKKEKNFIYPTAKEQHRNEKRRKMPNLKENCRLKQKKKKKKRKKKKTEAEPANRTGPSYDLTNTENQLHVENDAFQVSQGTPLLLGHGRERVCGAGGRIGEERKHTKEGEW